MNNLNRKKLETKSISNPYIKEQKEFSKLRDDEAMVTKPTDRGAAVVFIATIHYQSKIMQHLLGQNTDKKNNSCISNKIQSNVSRFFRQYSFKKLMFRNFQRISIMT